MRKSRVHGPCCATLQVTHPSLHFLHQLPLQHQHRRSNCSAHLTFETTCSVRSCCSRRRTSSTARLARGPCFRRWLRRQGTRCSAQKPASASRLPARPCRWRQRPRCSSRGARTAHRTTSCRCGRRRRRGLWTSCLTPCPTAPHEGRLRCRADQRVHIVVRGEDAVDGVSCARLVIRAAPSDLSRRQQRCRRIEDDPRHGGGKRLCVAPHCDFSWVDGVARKLEEGRSARSDGGRSRIKI
jgi:hypothetical protein